MHLTTVGLRFQNSTKLTQEGRHYSLSNSNIVKGDMHVVDWSLENISAAYNFSAASQFICDHWMCRDSMVMLERLWCRSGLIKWICKPVVGHWRLLHLIKTEKQTQARWDARPRGYTASVRLRLLKWPKLRMTSSQRTMCTAELTRMQFILRSGCDCSSFCNNFYKIHLFQHLRGAFLYKDIHACKKTCVTSPQGRIWQKRKMLFIFETVC